MENFWLLMLVPLEVQVMVAFYKPLRFSNCCKQTNFSFLNKGKIPNTDIELPYTFVSDEAFPLMPNLMRPFPRRHLNNQKQIFNYRLSRARRQVECTFGIVSSMWRIMRKTMEVDPCFGTDIVKVVCVLHNFLRATGSNGNSGVQTDASTTQVQPWINLPNVISSADKEARNVRDALMAYFISPVGSLPWQNDLYTNV